MKAYCAWMQYALDFQWIKEVQLCVITPSQKRVPNGENLRKQAMRRRKAKIEKYNRPKRERKRNEPKGKRKETEGKTGKIQQMQRSKAKKNKIKHR
jgi:hypothetical protein